MGRQNVLDVDGIPALLPERTRILVAPSGDIIPG
jgi:hypothetical protein